MSSELEVHGVDARSSHANEQLALRRHRPRTVVSHLENIGSTVASVGHRPHLLRRMSGRGQREAVAPHDKARHEVESALCGAEVRRHDDTVPDARICFAASKRFGADEGLLVR